MVDEALKLDLKRKEYEQEIQKLKDKLEPIKEKVKEEMRKLGTKELATNQDSIYSSRDKFIQFFDWD